MERMTCQIQRCTREYYDEFLLMLSTAFKSDGAHWFAKNCGHCCPKESIALDDEIQKNFIALDHDKVIGGLGVYPVDWVVSDGNNSVTLRMGGVGQVSCLEEYRGNGIMSELIKTGIKAMNDEQLDGSWLQGNRFRYGNYGWDFGGNSVIFEFDQKGLKRVVDANPQDYHIRTAQESDIETMNELYSEFPSRIIRNEHSWKRHLGRENLVWSIVSAGSTIGYTCYNTTAKNKFLEVQGDPLCVIYSLYDCLVKNNLDSIKVDYPVTEDALALFLYGKASHYSVDITANLNILDPDKVFAKLEPFIIAQAHSAVDTTSLSTADKDILCRKLLGYTYCPLPQTLKHFDFLKPLLFWLATVDDV